MLKVQRKWWNTISTNYVKINNFHISNQIGRKDIHQLIRATNSLCFRDNSGLKVTDKLSSWLVNKIGKIPNVKEKLPLILFNKVLVLINANLHLRPLLCLSLACSVAWEAPVWNTPPTILSGLLRTLNLRLRHLDSTW